MNVKRQVVRNLINYRGEKYKSKYVVFESDDWGSIRMPSLSVYEKLISDGVINQGDPFLRYDTLETKDDIENLCSVLNAYKDCMGNPPIITANFNTANPDFSSIRQSEYKHYAYKSFLTTYEETEDSEQCFSLIQSAIENKFFFPQFHGREHVNVVRWLGYLQSKHPFYLKAFEQGAFTVNPLPSIRRPYNLVAAYDFMSKEEENFGLDSFQDGMMLFNNAFGFSSRTFIAPNYTWNNAIEKVAAKSGVSIIQGSKFQYKPDSSHSASEKVRHFHGERNVFNQNYVLRNCLFEPSVNKSVNYVDECLKSISNAFFWGKPAIIGTHRLNFVSRLNRANRDANLDQLVLLLKTILKKWPDVEFVSSDFFADYFLQKYEKC